VWRQRRCHPDLQPMRVKRIDLPLVRFRPTDPEVDQRRRMNNVPVLLKKGEAPHRVGEIFLMFAERGRSTRS
jgi:hypothetical protein